MRKSIDEMRGLQGGGSHPRTNKYLFRILHRTPLQRVWFPGSTALLMHLSPVLPPPEHTEQGGDREKGREQVEVSGVKKKRAKLKVAYQHSLLQVLFVIQMFKVLCGHMLHLCPIHIMTLRVQLTFVIILIPVKCYLSPKPSTSLYCMLNMRMKATRKGKGKVPMYLLNHQVDRRQLLYIMVLKWSDFTGTKMDKVLCFTSQKTNYF